MITNLIIAVVGIAILALVGAVLLVVIGTRNPRGNVDENALQARLEEFSRAGEDVNLEKIEMSLSFNDRVLFPMARRVGDIAIRFTPQNALQQIRRKLELAGNPGRIDAQVFLSLQFGAAFAFGFLLFLATSIGQVSNWPFIQKFAIIIGGTLLGYYFPNVWLSSKITKRQKEVRKAMPDALDLLTVCVEAGLGFDAALAKVSQKWESELSLSFARVIQEIQLGKVRREALRDMANRIDIPEMTSFVAAIIQSEQLGVSMAKVLHIQSDQMRVKRRQLAEEEAHKAPIKMLIPMTILIFPSLMIVLMTPAGLRLMHSSLGAMVGQ